MRATMKDVAALAGVAVGTVSRVINGIKVKESTRMKVESAIKELNYEPDDYARGLKMNRTKTVALILPTIWHPFFSEFAYYVEETLSEKGYKLLLCNSDNNAKKESEYIQMVRQSKVDGIIGITYSDIDRYVSAQLPFVSIDRHFSEEVAYVTADNYHGGQVAAEELIARGCQELVYVGGTSPYPNETSNRKKGFEDYCQAKNISLKILDMKEPFINLEEQLAFFFTNNKKIDGIFSVNDFMGLKIIKVLKQLGKYPPEDYQLIGFDGIKMAADQEYPISTIIQPVQKMAQSAVEILMGLISNQLIEKRSMLPIHFQPGETTINL